MKNTDDPLFSHQYRIAKDTLRLSDAGAKILGGMTKEEARDFLIRAGWSGRRVKKFENYTERSSYEMGRNDRQ